MSRSIFVSLIVLAVISILIVIHVISQDVCPGPVDYISGVGSVASFYGIIITLSQNEFQVKLGNNGVSISYYDPEKHGYISGFPVTNQKPSVSLDVINSDGKEIDGETIEKGQKDYERLLDLYKEARRQCLRVDETLDEILKSL